MMVLEQHAHRDRHLRDGAEIMQDMLSSGRQGCEVILELMSVPRSGVRRG